MAIETFSLGEEVVTGRSELIRDAHYDTLILNHDSGSAYIGSFIEVASQSQGYCDLVDDGDVPYGVIVACYIKPSDTWTPATAIAKSTKVIVLRMGSNATIKAMINGDDAPTSTKKGAKPSAASTGLTIANKTRGAIYLGGSGAAIDNAIYITEDTTNVDTTSEAAVKLVNMTW